MHSGRATPSSETENQIQLKLHFAFLSFSYYFFTTLEPTQRCVFNLIMTLGTGHEQFPKENKLVTLIKKISILWESAIKFRSLQPNMLSHAHLFNLLHFHFLTALVGHSIYILSI